jgi:hypothetical protein
MQPRSYAFQRAGDGILSVTYFKTTLLACQQASQQLVLRSTSVFWKNGVHSAEADQREIDELHKLYILFCT